MATRSDVVVRLDGRAAAPDEPITGLDDPIAGRGDGVFETLLLRDGRACLLSAHLDRLARSAAIVGLPPPEAARWRAVVAAACARWPDGGDAVLRMVYGRDRTGGATGFVAVSELPARVAGARRHGVSAVTLDRGAPARGVPPWAIHGAKSLSYAVNAAALRHAERRGADDAVLLSSDGFVLEGPRSSVVIADGDGVLLTPPASMPILPGTTVRAVFDVAAARGIGCDERALRVADLAAAQAVWLLSSITLAARVHTLDGVALPTSDHAVDVPALVAEAITGP